MYVSKIKRCAYYYDIFKVKPIFHWEYGLKCFGVWQSLKNEKRKGP